MVKRPSGFGFGTTSTRSLPAGATRAQRGGVSGGPVVALGADRGVSCLRWTLRLSGGLDSGGPRDPPLSSGRSDPGHGDSGPNCPELQQGRGGLGSSDSRQTPSRNWTFKGSLRVFCRGGRRGAAEPGRSSESATEVRGSVAAQVRLRVLVSLPLA